MSLGVACLLAIAGLGAGLGAGWLARGGPSPAQSAFGTEPGGSVTTQSLVSGGRVLGYVTVYSQHSSAGSYDGGSWLFMSLEAGSWSGEATCEVHLADGSRSGSATSGSITATAPGVSRLPSGTGRISSASVVTAKGVLASASFTPDSSTAGAHSSTYPPGARALTDPVAPAATAGVGPLHLDEPRVRSPRRDPRR